MRKDGIKEFLGPIKKKKRRRVFSYATCTELSPIFKTLWFASSSTCYIVDLNIQIVAKSLNKSHILLRQRRYFFPKESYVTASRITNLARGIVAINGRCKVAILSLIMLFLDWIILVIGYVVHLAHFMFLTNIFNDLFVLMLIFLK